MSQAQDCGCTHRVLGAAEAGEPILALVEGEEHVVLGCGDGGCAADAAPSAVQGIRVERVRRGAEGAYEVVEDKIVDVEIRKNKLPGCLPWVKLVRDTSRYSACLAAARQIGQITDSGKLYQLLRDHMEQEDQEVFYVIMVDTQLYVRGINDLTRGARDRTLAPVPDVIRFPVIDGAMGFLVAHNHPSGNPRPSDADRELTKAIRKAADAVQISFLDHIVIGMGSYYSFKDNHVFTVGKRGRRT